MSNDPALADERPVRFAYDDDVTRWAVALHESTESWTVIRIDDGPHVETVERFLCTGGHWDLAGHRAWIVEGGGQWLVVPPGGDAWMVTYPKDGDTGSSIERLAPR